MRSYSIAPFLLAVTLMACQSTSAPAPYAASLGTEFTLAPEQRAVLEAQKLEVQFVRVVDDSRCPTDITCFWAGEVKVQLAIRIDSAQPTLHEVVAGRDTAVQQYRVTVVKVLPVPASTRTIAPEEYRATLKVM